MTVKEKKIDLLDRLLALLDEDSIDMLNLESFEILADENTIESDVLFYSKVNHKISDLYDIRDTIELHRNLLEE